jgi:alkylation response protein AidB-like acyl-CoA dehydrogenase
MHFELNEEQRMFRDTVRRFAETELLPRAREIDEQAEFPRDLLPKMAQLGLLGMAIPEQFGGMELDALSTAVAIEEIGRCCGSTALSVAAHTGLGCFPVVRWGTLAQKQRWLPELASGESLGALCLTEPGAGSDLRGVRTRAIRHDGGWSIRGTKAWITNPSLARVLVVFAVTEPEAGSRGYSLFLVPTDLPGLTIHPKEIKMGVRGSPTHQVSFDDVSVPSDSLLGEPGNGLKQTLETLDGGRISIGALSLGIAQGALVEAVRYAKERTAFEHPISDFEAIQWMIADAGTEIEAARLMVYQAAWLKDQGVRFTREAAMAKLYSTEMAERVTRNAIQILGSYGYSGEYPVERMYRDARLMTIGEGTSEVQRMVIARQLLR